MSEVMAHSPKVTMMPVTRNRFTAAPITSVRKRRTAGYARVSTDNAEQLTSYEAQVDYYTLMRSGDVVTEFTPELWNAVIDHATVSAKSGVTFTFRNQMEITV